MIAHNAAPTTPKDSEVTAPKTLELVEVKLSSINPAAKPKAKQTRANTSGTR
jgi:hypothetical protein